MGNRSRYVAAGAAAAAGALVARRRARLRRMMEGIGETVLPTHTIDLRTELRRESDEAHAPGHQHRPVGKRDEPGPRALPGRPWGKHSQRMTHPVAER